MTLSDFNLLVLLTSLALLLAQLSVKKKHTSHILFAVFCGSISMMMTQKISGDSIGAYQYLIGLGAIATCNGYWLLSRSLFRGKGAIASHHLALALAISLLIMIKQGYLFASSMAFIAVSSDSLASRTLSELTVLLSSCILVLSFWEGCRGYKNADKQERGQRILFLTTFATGVIVSKLSHGVDPVTQQWITGSLILLLLINTQILLFWQKHQQTNREQLSTRAQKKAANNQSRAPGVIKIMPGESVECLGNTDLCEEQKLAEKVKALLIKQQLFLQANLKVGDIAKALDLPEYRVSKAIRNHLNAKNFNQYVNELRISYAQEILAEPDKQQWPVLVVGLESGFASVGPFTRAFKAQTGFTPNQYRQNCLEKLALEAG